MLVYALHRHATVPPIFEVWSLSLPTVEPIITHRLTGTCLGQRINSRVFRLIIGDLVGAALAARRVWRARRLWSPLAGVNAPLEADRSVRVSELACRDYFGADPAQLMFAGTVLWKHGHCFAVCWRCQPPQRGRPLAAMDAADRHQKQTILLKNVTGAFRSCSTFNKSIERTKNGNRDQGFEL